MNRKTKYKRTKWVVPACCMLMSLIIAAVAWAQENAVEVKQTSEKTVETQIQTQDAAEAWLEEQGRLLDEIEAVEEELEHIRWQREKTAKYQETLERKVADLNGRAAEMETIGQELLVVLDRTLAKLEDHVESDMPFDREEREKHARLVRKVLDDYDQGLLQKTRVLFDAVAREVDIGHGVDVRDDEIVVEERLKEDRLKQVKLLRVGRVGLYALTMDARSAYLWDGDTGKWVAVAESARQIEQAVEMAEGTRIIELSRLPVGRPETERKTKGGRIAND